MVYVPAAWGHGFLTVTDDTEIFHPMSQFYNADSAQGRAVGRSGVPRWLGRRKWK
jgi:dTDP-4-dehydrorhamnose 3,5-epimerase-like enzyme